MQEDKEVISIILKYGGIATSTILSFALFAHYPDYLFSPHFSMIRFLGMSVGFLLLYMLRAKLPGEFLNIAAFCVILGGIMIYPLYSPSVNGADILALPIGGLLLGTIPLAVYNPLTQKTEIITWVSVFIIVCIVVTKLSLPRLQGAELEMFSEIFSRRPMITLAFIASYISLNWIIFQYQLTEAKTKEQLESVNQILKARIAYFKRRSAKIEKDNSKLQEKQQELLTAKIGLESKVENATHDLNEKTKLLIKYSYINSHVLRAPIARIKSVIEVWDLMQDSDRKDIITSSAHELKSIIDIISNVDEDKIEKVSESLQDYYCFQ